MTTGCGGVAGDRVVLVTWDPATAGFFEGTVPGTQHEGRLRLYRMVSLGLLCGALPSGGDT